MAGEQILIVEDEGIIALDLKGRLNRLGYEVPAIAASGGEAFKYALDIKPDMILMDIRIKGDMDGVDTAHRIREFTNIPVIFISAHADAHTIERVKETCPYGYLTKPFNEKELLTTIETGLYKHDVEKKLLERNEQLTKFQDELIRSNAELQEFAYIASHDLQEPLRMISSYVQLLERRYKGKLDDDADQFIDYVVDGADRMQKMIRGLLDYSRVGTKGMDFAETEFTNVLDQALTNLQASIQESGAVITHDPLPSISVDSLQMTQLFQNLIGNAIKFRNSLPPAIHISAEQTADEWVFSISDNGIGIDPEYADRIFKVFQRLNTRDEYEGTGIGLSICKKIVQRHGGRIWLKSNNGSGSIFYFTIPMKEK